MNNKLLKILSLVAISLSIGFVVGSPSEKIEEDFKEYVYDIDNKSKGIAISRGLQIGDGTMDVSQTFVQYAEKQEEGSNYYYLRFATAVKGEISSLKYTRGQVSGKLEETKEVSLVYSGLNAAGQTYYYTGDASINNGLTTDSSYLGKYYWACYTIRYSSLDLVDYDVDMTLKVNDDITNVRSASLTQLLYGDHDHNNNHYFMTPYNVGDEFKLEEFEVYRKCQICNGGRVDIDYESVNVADGTVLGLNDTLNVKISNSQILTNPITMRLEAEDSTVTASGTSKIGIKDKTNWMTDTCSGETFIASANVGDTMEFRFNSQSNATMPLIVAGASTAINKGLTNLTETPLNSVITVYVNGTEIEIPSTSVLEGKTSATSDRNLWVNWTRANLGTINVVEGENVIKFVFKNDNKLSNQYDTNAIGSYDYIELNSQPDHVLESKFDEEYHWKDCSCGFEFVDEKIGHTFALDVKFANDRYRKNSLINESEISLIVSCDCGFEQKLVSGYDVIIPESNLKLGDKVIVSYDNQTLEFEIPVYDLNIQHVPVKQDYQEGEKLDLTGLVLNRKFTNHNENYDNFDVNDVVYEDKVLTTKDKFVTLSYDGLTIDLPITVKKGITKIELENLEVVDVESGVAVNGSQVTPKPKSGVSYENNVWKYGNVEYGTYEEAYTVGYSKLTAAGKTQVENASGKDFLATLDGTGVAFTVNLGQVDTSSYRLYLRGASNYCTSISSWTPKKVGELPIHEIMTLEVNGVEVDYKDATLPGIGDGSTASHSYWTNWFTLDLGEISLDPNLENNTIRFYFTEDNAIDENTGKYKYLYYPTKAGAYAFGQYDYMMIEPLY